MDDIASLSDLSYALDHLIEAAEEIQDREGSDGLDWAVNLLKKASKKITKILDDT